ncbi:hypothetical protein GBA63_19140 [Rubrobacter tropicus]|uniref:SnoaL-like domain-containing protein n=1 Tax=Rubrobacter tropicus TaxID=2653851 RepID=A0A6G8QDK5_9ACTN|nr:hypothetical protein [Rubrobacter tropicus]QIN84522.1 hypothetical protein GBA63_19140 [Rubrobacter tropicus]
MAGLIADFFRAFNAGNGPELRRTFAPGNSSPPLYGVGTGEHGRGAFGANRREELLRYFADRHRDGERLRLFQVGVTASGREDTAEVTYLVARSADDLGPVLADARRAESGGFLYFGKAVIDCETRKILAWNMDAEERSDQGKEEFEAGPPEATGLCPARPNRKPEAVVVACAL